MKIQVTCCKDRYSSMVQEEIDVKKFLVFEPEWLWMVRCVSDDKTAEVVWECRKDNTYVLFSVKIDIKGSGVMSVFPAVVWVGDKPEIVEWDKIDPGRSEVKDPFYVMVYNRTDLVKFSDLVLSKLSPVVLMTRLSDGTETVQNVIFEIINSLLKEVG